MTPPAETGSFVDGLIAHGMSTGRSPEEIAGAVKKWRDAGRDYAESTVKDVDPLRWFRGNEQLDAFVTGKMDGLRSEAWRRTALEELPEGADFEEFRLAHIAADGKPERMEERWRSAAEKADAAFRSEAFDIPETERSPFVPLATERGVQLGRFQAQTDGEGGLNIALEFDSKDKKEDPSRHVLHVPEVTDEDIAAEAEKARKEAAELREQAAKSREARRSMVGVPTGMNPAAMMGVEMQENADLAEAGELDERAAILENAAAERTALADAPGFKAGWERARVMLMQERVEEAIKNDKALSKKIGKVNLAEDFWRGTMQTAVGARVAIEDWTGDEESVDDFRGLVAELDQAYPGSTNWDFRGGARGFVKEGVEVTGGMAPTLATSMVGGPVLGLAGKTAGMTMRIGGIAPITASSYGQGLSTMLNDADALDKAGRHEEAQQRRDDARGYAWGQAGVETLSEFVFPEEMFRLLPSKKFVGRIAEGMAQNAVEETIAGLGGAQLDMGFRGEATSMGEIGRQAGLGAFVGGVIQVPGATLGVLARKFPKKKESPESGDGRTGGTPPPETGPPDPGQEPGQQPPPPEQEPDPQSPPPGETESGIEDLMVVTPDGKAYTFLQGSKEWAEVQPQDGDGPPLLRGIDRADPANETLITQLESARNQMENGQEPTTFHRMEGPENTAYRTKSGRVFVPVEDGWTEVFPETGDAPRPFEPMLETEGADILKELEDALVRDRGEEEGGAPVAGQEAPSGEQQEPSSGTGEQQTEQEGSQSTPRKLYMETSIESVGSLLPFDPSRANNPFGGVRFWFSDNPDLALGQGSNRGVLLEFDDDFGAQENHDKPASEFSGPEFTSDIQPSELQNHLRAVTVKPDAEGAPAFARRLRRMLNNSGWERTENSDGSVTYRKPEEAPQISRVETEEPPTPQESQPHGTVSSGQPNGAKARFRYRAVDASSIPQMLARDIGEDQTRQREGNVASSEQVERIATGLDPDFVLDSRRASDGAPVVDGGTVIAGNGRSEGIAEAYRRGLAGNYEAAARQFAEENGIEIGEDVAQPVIVREVIDYESGDRRSFVVESNPKRGGMGESVSEQALLDAEAIGDETLSGLTFTANGDLTAESLNAVAARLEEANRGVTRSQRGKFDKAEATRRVMAAFLSRLAGKAGRDPADVASLLETDGGKRAVSAVANAAPRLARLDDDISLASELMDALLELKSGAQSVAKGDFKNMADWAANRQGELLGDELSDVSSEILAEMVESATSPAGLRALLDEYLGLAENEQNERDNEAQTGNLFGDERTSQTPEDLFRKLGRLSGTEAAAPDGSGNDQRGQGESKAEGSAERPLESPDTVLDRLRSSGRVREDGSVLAPNGQPSELFRALLEETGDYDAALRRYAEFHSQEFKEENGDWEGLERQGRAGQLIDSAISDKRNQSRVLLEEGDVDPTGRISEALGQPITKHYITFDDVRKTFKRHGEGNERRADQVGITRDDLVAALELLRNPGNIKRTTSRNGKPSVEISREFSDGTLFVAEVTIAEPGAISLKSAWKKLPSGNNAGNQSGPVRTSETAGGIGSTISSDSLLVNPDSVTVDLDSNGEPVLSDEEATGEDGTGDRLLDRPQRRRRARRTEDRMSDRFRSRPGNRKQRDQHTTQQSFEDAFARHVEDRDFQAAYEAVRDTDDSITKRAAKKWRKAGKSGDQVAAKRSEWLNHVWNGTTPDDAAAPPPSPPPPPSSQAPPAPPSPPPPVNVATPPRPDPSESFNIPALVYLAELLGAIPVVKRIKGARGYYQSSNRRGERQTNPVVALNEFLGKGDWQQAARTLAHEIGHLIDYIVMAVPRADLRKRLLPLESAREDFIELLTGGKGKKESNAVRDKLKEEAVALSKIMRGDFDPNDSYRNSSVELYADFVSALLTDPDLAWDTAPTMTAAWFAGLESKSDAEAAWQTLNDLIKGDTLMDAIREKRKAKQTSALKSWRERAMDRMRKALAWRNAANALVGGFWSSYIPAAVKGQTGRFKFLKRWWDAARHPMKNDHVARMQEIEKEFPQRSSALHARIQRDVMGFLQRHGIDSVRLDEALSFLQILNEDTATLQYLRENVGEFREFLLWLDEAAGTGRAGEIEAAAQQDAAELDSIGAGIVGEIQMNGQMEEVLQLAQSKDAPDIAEDGLFAFDIARYQWNAEGHTPDTAREGMERLRKELGEQRYQALLDAVEAFHGILKPIVEEANRVGMFKTKTWDEKIKPNLDNYVPRMVLDYFTGEVSATVHQRRGSVKATMPKQLAAEAQAMVLLKKIADQKATLQTFEEAKRANWSDEIAIVPQGIRGDKAKRQAEKDGKGVRGFYKAGRWHWAIFDSPEVVAFIPKTWGDPAYRKATEILRRIGNFWRLSYTMLRGSFLLVNNAVRAVFELPAAYGPGAFWHAIKRRGDIKNWADASLGRAGPNDRVLSLVERGVLPPFGDYVAADIMLDPDQLVDMVMEGAVGVDSISRLRAGTSRTDRAVTAVLNAPVIKQVVGAVLHFTGMVEAMPKVASESLLEKRGVPQWERDRLAAMEGIPNVGIRAGQKGPMMDLATLFYRVTVQGARRMANLPVNPRTRGWFWTTVGLIHAQKAFYVMAAAGAVDAVAKMLAGGEDDEEEWVDWQTAYSRISRYKIAHTDAFLVGWATPDRGEGNGYEPPWGHTAIPGDWTPIFVRTTFSETGRHVAPLASMLLFNLSDSSLKSDDPVRDARDLVQTFLPDLNPFVKGATTGGVFAIGNPAPPRDPYSGADIVPKEEWERGFHSRAWGLTRNFLEQTPAGNFMGQPESRKNENLSGFLGMMQQLPLGRAVLSLDNPDVDRAHWKRREERDKISREARALRGSQTKRAVSLLHRLEAIPAEERTDAELSRISVLRQWYNADYLGNSRQPGLFQYLQAAAAGDDTVDAEGAKEALEQGAKNALELQGRIPR